MPSFIPSNGGPYPHLGEKAHSRSSPGFSPLTTPQNPNTKKGGITTAIEPKESWAPYILVAKVGQIRGRLWESQGVSTPKKRTETRLPRGVLRGWGVRGPEERAFGGSTATKSAGFFSEKVPPFYHPPRPLGKQDLAGGVFNTDPLRKKGDFPLDMNRGKASSPGFSGGGPPGGPH